MSPIWVSAHRSRSGDRAWQRRRFARRNAERRLAEARKDLAEGRSRDALRAVRSALVGLIADMRNIVAEGLTTSEASAALAQTSLSSDAAKTPQEYRESAALLESLLADEFRCGAVYYNLGNAYYRAAEYGRAIAAYRKAKPYCPRDPYLEANLRQALSVAPGRLPEPPPQWWRHVLFWKDWLSFPEKAYGAFAAILLASVAACAALFLRRGSGYWISGALLVAGAILSLDAALSYADVAGSRHGVVTSETIARKGIGRDYEPAFDQPLKDGAEFTVLSEKGDWILGHFEGIGDGWLRREHTVL
jgi:tetratricopeptide (TPR) repeat protein